jgi:RHS repeat-associated protein
LVLLKKESPKLLISSQRKIGNAQFQWVHTNHLGNGYKMTDSAGAVVFREEYDPHGQTVYRWAPNGPWYLSRKFTGYERDYGTNTDYANARQYHHNNNRFLQPDPLGLGASDPGNPQSLNLYSYVQNDPVNYVDPSGTLAVFCEADTMTCDANGCTIRAGSCYIIGGGGGGGGGIGGGGGGTGGDIGGGSGGGQSGGGFDPGPVGGEYREPVDETAWHNRNMALLLARIALATRGDCFELISGRASNDPLGLLNTLDRKGEFIQSPHPIFTPRINFGVEITWGFAQGSRENARIRLNPGGPGTGISPGTLTHPNPGGLAMRFNLSQPVALAILFLHELSHATRKFNDTTANDGRFDYDITYRALNSEIYKACFGLGPS